MESETCDSCGRDDYRKPSVAVDAVALREGESTVHTLSSIFHRRVQQLRRSVRQRLSVPQWLRQHVRVSAPISLPKENSAKLAEHGVGAPSWT